MGRKRKNIEMTRVVVVVPKSVKDDLKEAGVNMTQLFLHAAEERLKQNKK